jgi:hypothetical protein
MDISNVGDVLCYGVTLRGIKKKNVVDISFAVDISKQGQEMAILNLKKAKKDLKKAKQIVGVVHELKNPHNDNFQVSIINYSILRTSKYKYSVLYTNNREEEGVLTDICFKDVFDLMQKQIVSRIGELRLFHSVFGLDNFNFER